MDKLRKIFLRAEWWLVIIPLVAYRQIAFFKSTMQWDMTDQAFVWHRFISQCFHQHILPLWCPYSRLGYPFFTDPQSGLFYPVVSAITYFFHYTLYTNNAEYILHVIGAAFAMRYLLMGLNVNRYTACIFGLVYALSGPFVSNASHIVFIYSLCWLPFVLGSYIRLLKSADYRFALLTALFLFMQITGGYVGLSIILFYVQVFILLYYAVLFFYNSKLSIVWVAINHVVLAACTMLLLAGFMYAVLKGLPYIDRQNGISLQMANGQAFTPASMLSLVFPFAVNNEHVYFTTDITMRNLYMGLLTLLLILVSFLKPNRNKWFLLTGSILFLFAAMGAVTPVRGMLFRFVPLMNMFRMASIFRFFSCIGFLILAAWAFDEIFEKKLEASMASFKRYILIAIGLVVCFATAMLFISMGNWHKTADFSLYILTGYFRHEAVYNILFAEGLIQLLILGSAIFILTVWSNNNLLRKYMFAALMVFDMVVSVQGNMFSTISCGRSLAQIQGAIDKLPNGFSAIQNLPLITHNEWNDTSIAPPVWHNAGFLKKQITFDGYNGYNLTAYNELADGKDFYKIIAERRVISASPDSVQLSISCFTPGYISFNIKSDTIGKVYVGQMYFPGWSISIDGGNNTPVAKETGTNFIMCYVPKGSHKVDLIFQPKGADFAFIYTIIAFITCLAITVLLFIGPIIL
jgi:hypothetical protein